MSRRLGPISARRHFAPPTGAVTGTVKKQTTAAWIATTAHADEFARYQRIGCRFNNWNQQSGEYIANSYKAAREAAVGAWFNAPRTGAAAEDAVDLANGSLGGTIRRSAAPFGEDAQRVANPARLVERRARTGRLLLRTPEHGGGTLSIQRAGRTHPPNKRFE